MKTVNGLNLEILAAQRDLLIADLQIIAASATIAASAIKLDMPPKGERVTKELEDIRRCMAEVDKLLEEL